MRVFLFGLSSRGINLMNLFTEPVRLVLLFLYISSCDASFMFGLYAYDTVFHACFWFRFIDMHVLVPACHLAIVTHWGVFYSPGSSCQDPRAWSLWIPLDAYQRCVAEVWIISRPSRNSILPTFPACLSSFPLATCEAICIFIIVYLFVFSHLHLSVMLFM